MSESEQKIRYAVNVDAWVTGTRVMGDTIDAVLDYLRPEIESLQEEGDDTITITISAVKMTDAEVEALPEWDGP